MVVLCLSSAINDAGFEPREIRDIILSDTVVHSANLPFHSMFSFYIKFQTNGLTQYRYSRIPHLLIVTKKIFIPESIEQALMMDQAKKIDSEQPHA